ncbi:MAG TPA: serine/threonine-protein kinase [Gemmatimonadaceae bacterium]|nr:serine/threonine-protein kinase [Gemmatimonadaceae bacterium]
MSELLDRVVAALGRQYEVECEIGRGGMSVVYRARDVRLNRLVAIKVLPPELAYDPAVRTRFTREAQTSAQLSHSHIVPIYDVGETEGIAYFVMGYVTGGNLAALLAREPRQPLDETRRIICEVADALAYAHTRGVIHRDIKPDNILLDRDTGRAMVTDFGIARAMEGGTRLTQTGIAVGTPTYMSPEQAEGREVDGRSDIYSLGVVGYQMLTGRVPFTAASSMALLLKHVTERPRAIAELRPDTPRVLRDAVERSLMKSPEDRWPTASALRDTLMSDQTSGAPWRAEHREPVRYASPIPRSSVVAAGGGSALGGRRNEAPAPASVVPGAPPAPPLLHGSIVMERPEFAAFTPEQRHDNRIWHGRINLYDRVKAMRGYTWLTFATWVGALAAQAALGEGIIPVLALPVIPWFMSKKWMHRARSLRASGLRVRRVILMPRAKWVLPKPPKPAADALEKLAPRAILDSTEGVAIRRAVEDRDAIVTIAASLSREDREMLPDLGPTANGLVDRIVQLATSIHDLQRDFDPRLLRDLDSRIAEVQSERPTPEGERRLALLQRQRGSLESLAQRRMALSRQMDNAGLALGNLKLDLMRLRSSGLQSALSDLSNATQEARILSREIGAVLEAAADVRAGNF